MHCPRPRLLNQNASRPHPRLSNQEARITWVIYMTNQKDSLFLRICLVTITEDVKMW